MKDGWVYTFIIKDNCNLDDFKDCAFHCGDYEDGYIYISRIKQDEIRVILYSVTRRQAEKLLIKLHGSKLRILDKFTFDTCYRFFLRP